MAKTPRSRCILDTTTNSHWGKRKPAVVATSGHPRNAGIAKTTSMTMRMHATILLRLSAMAKPTADPIPMANSKNVRTTENRWPRYGKAPLRLTIKLPISSKAVLATEARNSIVGGAFIPLFSRFINEIKVEQSDFPLCCSEGSQF